MLISFFQYAWASSSEKIAVAAAVTVAFAVAARVVRGVNPSGAMAGGTACFLLFAGAGPAAFAALVALFAVTWISTRLGYRCKSALGVAERREGRNAWQVLANLAAPALGAVIFSATGKDLWLVAALAALTEAAIDTVASEIGQYRARDARMITTWQPVAAGTDGGITIAGSVAGLAAGVVVAAVAALGGLVAPSRLWIAMVAGFVGMIVDSVLGATAQRRGWIDNQMVNLVSTLAAGALAWVIVALA